MVIVFENEKVPNFRPAPTLDITVLSLCLLAGMTVMWVRLNISCISLVDFFVIVYKINSNLNMYV